MSNLSLKEQLKALSLSGDLSTPMEQDHQKESQKTFSPQTEKERTSKKKPLWLEHAQYGVELLKAYFPNCFKELKEISPLKVGIKQDLVKQLSGRDDIVLSDKACMVSSLSYYVNSSAYHKSMVVGVARIDLEGNAAGTVTAEEAQYAVECRKAKLQKKQTKNASSPPAHRKTAPILSE